MSFFQKTSPLKRPLPPKTLAQGRDTATGRIPQGAQGVPQHREEDMKPLSRCGLAHTEHASMEQVHGMLLEGDQHAHQTIFWGGQGTVRIGRVASRLPAPSMQGPCGYGVQERRLKGRHQGRKLVHGYARQISYLGGMRWNIAIT